MADVHKLKSKWWGDGPELSGWSSRSRGKHFKYSVILIRHCRHDRKSIIFYGLIIVLCLFITQSSNICNCYGIRMYTLEATRIVIKYASSLISPYGFRTIITLNKRLYRYTKEMWNRLTNSTRPRGYERAYITRC